jgi:UDP-N-acetylmuramate--alanine ligase
VIGGQAQQRRRQLAAGLGRLHRGRGRRVRRLFLNLLPVMAVVTNIDADHMETYGHDFGG